MALTLSTLGDLNNLQHDEIIDVRSPAEYAEDHVPGSINLPVLTDTERAQVGTIYKQESPFKARKIGAALVAQNAARHLQTHLADKPGNYRPLVYCWRGGQRSNAFAAILSQIGWRAQVVGGGYKTYRRLVVDALYDQPFPCPVILLDGDTGSGKTDILNRLPALGWQVLDLEGLARHRGSVLGAYTQAQPSQKGFESALAMGVERLDPTRPVVVEAESSRVGEINLPPMLWAAMCAAPRLVIEVPRPARARYLVKAYDDLSLQDASERLMQLRRLHGAARLAEWQEMLSQKRFEALALSLMEVHYDPVYRRGRKGHVAHTLALPDTALLPDTIESTARSVAEALGQIRTPAASGVLP
ncbi:tRNA 2-selenouridine(34) synthase MnmH [Tropicimonas sp. S265A]|uniref:tRNA 2-selenouridine(34) synthase MnmH n=1 Tax=Tropicimonas sp. S265A TaxID=3415134 RepID=UPI003C7A8485